MKQLIANGKPTNIFFSNTSTMDGIVLWIMNWMGERLDVNEPHSCTVTVHQSTIVISGDEDMIEIDINIINPINV